IGYSGWEGDVIMRSLQTSLGEPGSYVYWFCYSIEDFEALPSWLKNHPCVYFILPEAEHLPDAPPALETASGDCHNGSGADSTGETGSETLCPRLKAETVFEEMLRAWNAGIPSLTR